MRILYVEDDELNLSLVERIARMGNHEIINYAWAEDALENFDADNPDMVLADFMLAGEMDGLEMVRELRHAGYNRPIVAVSAYTTKDASMDAGCDYFFEKPIPVERLGSLIEEYAESLN